MQINGKILSISEMAQIHDISRQTLIYYDKIGLFRPESVDENGYRYYNSMQIPLLREICFLKSIGIKLEDIKTNITKTSNCTIELLEQQERKLHENLCILHEQKKQIKQRVNIYKTADEYTCDEYKPTIEYFPKRKAIWVPWSEDDITRRGIHVTLMKIWNITSSHGHLPNRRWGAILFKDYLNSSNPLHNAGGCTFIPPEIEGIENTVVFPAGNYVCMSKYGMPYELAHVEKLVRWIYDNGYKIIGNIYDECIMDSIFYDNDGELDYCQLQIPIAPIEETINMQKSS